MEGKQKAYIATVGLQVGLELLGGINAWKTARNNARLAIAEGESRAIALHRQATSAHGMMLMQAGMSGFDTVSTGKAMESGLANMRQDQILLRLQAQSAAAAERVRGGDALFGSFKNALGIAAGGAAEYSNRWPKSSRPQ